MSEIKSRAQHSAGKKAAFGVDLDLESFSRQGGDWDYDPDYGRFSPEERRHLLKAGVELTDEEHAGTFLQTDARVVHCRANQEGVEVLPITEAMARYEGLTDYLWRLVAVDADKYTAQAELALDNGFSSGPSRGLR